MKRNRRIIAEASMWEADKRLRPVLHISPATDDYMDYYKTDKVLNIEGSLPKDMKIIDIFGRKRKVTKKYVPYVDYGRRMISVQHTEGEGRAY